MEQIPQNFQELSPKELQDRATEIFQASSPTHKQIFNISLEEFRELISAQIDISSLYLLECISNNIDILKELPLTKVKSWYQTLRRKGYILDDGKLSETGKSILSIVKAGGFIKKDLVKVEDKIEDDFEKWWRAFPSNDIFTYKGRLFQGNRGLRVNKEKCRAKFNQIMNEGEYKLEDMLRVLEYEIVLRKENSIKTGENKLQYLSGTEPYLNQRKFESFMDISKEQGVQKITQATQQYSGYDI